EVSNRLHHVLAIAIGVGKRGAFVEDPTFDTPSQMFGEVAVDLRVDWSDRALRIELYSPLESLRLRTQNEGSGKCDYEITAGDHGGIEEISHFEMPFRRVGW